MSLNKSVDGCRTASEELVENLRMGKTGSTRYLNAGSEPGKTSNGREK
jgi:hypothetical protein